MNKKYLALGLIFLTTTNFVKAETVVDARLDERLNSTYIGKKYNQKSTAYHNTALGFNSMPKNYRLERPGVYGSGNSALGSYALSELTTGEYNTGVGLAALQFLTTGSNNTAIGEGALNKALENSNTALGFEAGIELTKGSMNTLLGYRAGKSSTINFTEGSNNILIGNEVSTCTAKASNELNIGNLIKGVLAGTKSVTVDGSFAAKSLSTAGNIAGQTLSITGQGGIKNLSSDSIATGTLFSRGQILTKGITSNGGAAVTVGNLFVSQGYGDFFGGVTTKATVQADKALFLKQRSSTDTVPTIPSGYAGLSIHNTGKLMYHSPITGEVAAPVMITEVASIGDLADAKTTNVGGSIFVGQNSGRSAGASYRNTALGSDTMKESVGTTDNTAIGHSALTNNTQGNYNVAIGSNSLFSHRTGHSNIAIGHTALYFQESSYDNIAIGSGAMSQNLIGSESIAIGTEAGASSRKGRGNINLGYRAGIRNGTVEDYSTGDYNINIGYEVSSPSKDGSNQLNIGNLIKGNMATGSKSVTIDGNLTTTGLLKIAGGNPGVGKVLTSDATGNATWQAAPTPIIADNTITSSKILDGSVSSADLAVGSVKASHVGLGAVGSPQILDGSVNGSDLANNSVYDNKIVNVSASKITGVISPAQIPTNLSVHTVQTLGVGLTTPQRPLHIKDVMRLEPRSTTPNPASKGDIFMHSTGALCVYNGNNWDQINAGLADSRCTDSSTEPSILWQLQEGLRQQADPTEQKRSFENTLGRG